MNMKTVLATLATVATDLDREGLIVEANVLDKVLDRLVDQPAPAPKAKIQPRG